MAIEFKTYESIENALDAHKVITGSGLFDGYENSKAPRLKTIETGRVGVWMVDQATGDIYYLFEDDRNGLRLLNKLSLGACLDNSPFQRVQLDHEDGIMFIGNADYSKSNKARRLMGKAEWIVATNMAPTNCDECVRFSTCHWWANFDQHDKHEPCRCERFTTDPAVLVKEAADLAELKAKRAQAEIDDPVPF